jgi:thioredoxin reductase (NADPH)
MDTHVMTDQIAAGGFESSRPPVLLVVDSDQQALLRTVEALRQRFAPDFRVVTAATADAGMELLSELASAAEDVALVAADVHLPGKEGVDFLERAHAVYPGASRVLLVPMDRHHTRISFTELHTLQRATALGRIDSFVTKGWVTPEEWLYPQVQEALTRWTKAHRPGHLVYQIVGEQWASRSHELRDWLSRSGVPFRFIASETGAGTQLMQAHGVDPRRLPAVIHHDGRVLYDPTNAEVASSHGIQTQPSSDVYDLAILGAGPAGLAAAVYGASEGLNTLVLESGTIGGQAASSSMIRNYLGFPRGVGGGELAHQAWEQAVLLGADFVFTQSATGLASRGSDRVISLTNGLQASARAVIVAVGVTYRRLGIPALDRHVGAGVFYGAASSEAPALAGEDVFVVGGANSAGQAALHLAKYAKSVSLLVRGDSLTAGMSDYLVRQLNATSNVEVRLQTRVVDGWGQTRLEALTLEDIPSGRRQEALAAAVFILIGAEPRTDWLSGAVRLDERGFVLTGRDIPPGCWRLARAPLPFETSLPGVFAAGDVRYGSVKRVAGAVGEGSVTVGSVHQYLADPKM